MYDIFKTFLELIFGLIFFILIVPFALLYDLLCWYTKLY